MNSKTPWTDKMNKEGKIILTNVPKLLPIFEPRLDVKDKGNNDRRPN